MPDPADRKNPVGGTLSGVEDDDGRDEALTLRDEDPEDTEETKLAPLTAAAAAAAGEVAHSSEVQRAVARARAELDTSKDAATVMEPGIVKDAPTITKTDTRASVPEEIEPLDDDEDDGDFDEPTKVRPSGAAAAVPNLAFDEPPPREQTALMPGAPGRSLSPGPVPAFPLTGANVRLEDLPSVGALPIAHGPSALAFSGAPLGPPPPPAPSAFLRGADDARWWWLVAIFAVVAISVPFAVYFALREEPGEEAIPAAPAPVTPPPAPR